MKKGQQLLRQFLLLIAVLFHASLFAQEKFNADSLFHAAHDQAVAGKYSEAITMVDRILTSYPEYHDARILKARSFAWQKDYTTAIKEINILLREDKKHHEANEALCDFYLWKHDYQSSRRVAKTALGYYPDDEKFLFKILQNDFAAEEFEQAEETRAGLLKLYPDNAEAKEILRSIEMQEWKNEFRFEHFTDGHNEPFKRRWHMSSAGYGRKTSFGTYYAKVNIGDLVEPGDALYDTDVDVEYAFEAYPKFNKYNYMFLNYSTSSDEFFPKNRIGAEYYHVFKESGIEVSLGYRYLHFDPEVADEVKVNIYTGTFARYIGKYWVSARPYIVDDGEDTFFRYTLSIRTFLKPDVSYVEWFIGTGTSPENPVFYVSGPARSGLDLWRVEMEWKQRISKLISLELEAGFENTEYDFERRRNQLILRAALSFLF